MASIICKQFQHNKKHLVSITFPLPYYRLVLQNTETHENKRSNPKAYTPIKMHIYTTFNKNPLPTNPISSAIPKIHDQICYTIHLPAQQKHDAQPLQPRIN